MKVFLNKAMPTIGMELLAAANIEVVLPENENITRSEWLAYCKNSDAVIGVGSKGFDKDFFETCPNVKAIALFSVGYDQVDIAAATEHKVAVGNTPDVLSRATSDVAFLLMQSVARLASFNFERVKNGGWINNFNPLANLGQELYGKTLGVFGLGRIGFEMAKKCKAAFDMNIIYHNRNPKEDLAKPLEAQYVSFETLLAQSDVLSIHASYTPASKDLFDKAAFQQMQSNAILINTARGGFVNEKDLYEALQQKTIWGAGLDVTATEPTDVNNPLLSLQNVCVLPHIGSATTNARDGMARLVAENIIAFSKGEKMPTIVNEDVYEK